MAIIIPLKSKNMGSTRKNRSNQVTSDIADRMTEMEVKFQEGIEKLRSEYILVSNGRQPDINEPVVFEEKLKNLETKVKNELQILKDEMANLLTKVSHNEKIINKRAQNNNEKKRMFRDIPENQTSTENLMDTLINLTNEKLNVNITKNEIAHCYRIRNHQTKQGSTYAPPVIVEYIHQWRRDEIFFNKKMMKGSGITICEVLTSENYNLFMKVRKKFGNQAWTIGGNIFVFHKNKKIRISDEQSLQKLL